MSPQLPTVLLRAQTDERLVRLCALGSERAFEAVVERYRRPLLGYARRIAGESRAEDIVQAAFLSAWDRLTAGTDVRDLRAWLFRIVHNGAINAVKRASASDVELFDDTPALADLHIEVERREEVRRTLDGIAALPLQQREALLGVAVQGRRHRDVGAELGVTDGAVRMLLHRARSSMRTAATALTPLPVIGWLTGERGTDVAAGGAGAGMLAGGALKAAALLSAAAVAVSAAPPAAHRAGADGAAAAVAAAPATLSAQIPATLTTPAAPGPAAAVRHETSDAATPDARTGPAPATSGPATPPAPAESAPPTAPIVVQQDDSTAIPHQDAKDPVFLHPADGEDDEIAVPDEPPDLAAGEQPIPKDGLPDAVGEAALPEAPAAAQDQAELAADPQTPADDPPADAPAPSPAPAP